MKIACGRFLWNCLVLVSAVGLAEESSYQRSASSNANALTSVTLSGQWTNVAAPLRWQELQGRVVIIGIWRSSDPNSIAFLGELSALAERWGDRVTLLSVHSGKFGGERLAESFQHIVARYNVRHPVVNDVDSTVTSNLGVSVVPSALLVGGTGEVYRVHYWTGVAGLMDKDLRFLVEKSAGKLVTSPLASRKPSQKRVEALLPYPAALSLIEDYLGSPLLVVSLPSQHCLVGLRVDGQIVNRWGKCGEGGFRDGDAVSARLQFPSASAYSAGSLYVSDAGNQAVRKIELASGNFSTIAGTGVSGKLEPINNAVAKTTALQSPRGLVVSANEAELLVAMASANQIWSLKISNGILNSVAGGSVEGISDGAGYLASLAAPTALVNLAGRIFFLDSASSALRELERGGVKTLIGQSVSRYGKENGGREDALMHYPTALTGIGNKIYIADTFNHQIREFDLATNTIETLVGKRGVGNLDGNFFTARFNEPRGIVAHRGHLFVSDTNNHAIRVVDLDTKVVRTLAIKSEKNSRRSVAGVPDLIRIQRKSPLNISIQLPPGWELSQPRSTFLTVETEMKARRTVMKRFDFVELKKGAAAVGVNDFAKQWRVRGTLHFCRSGAAAQCSVRNIDKSIEFSPDGASHLALLLEP